MSAVTLAIASRIPVVNQHKTPMAPAGRNVTAITALTVEPNGLGHHQLVARARGVLLNLAALIACRYRPPDLGTGLCWRKR